MKRKIATLCVLVLIPGVLVLAETGVSLSGSSRKATGGVGFTYDDEKVCIELTAHEGDPAKGMLNFRTKEGWFRMDIQCVTVMDTLAFFSGSVVRSSEDELIGRCFRFGVCDVGSPRSKGDWVTLEETTNPKECKPFDPGYDFPVGRGNLVVHWTTDHARYRRSFSRGKLFAQSPPIGGGPFLFGRSALEDFSS